MRFKVGVLLVIFCLCAAGAMAVSGGDGGGAKVVSAVVKSPSQSARQENEAEQSQADSAFDLGSIRHRGAHKIQTSSLFESKSWYTPPPPPPPAPAPVSLLPPPPPTPPQLPYTYIGRMIDGKDVVLFLTKNDQHYTVRASDVLDNTYRVDKITEKEAVLTYIPLDAQQTLVFEASGGSNPSQIATASSLATPSVLPFQQQPNLTQPIK